MNDPSSLPVGIQTVFAEYILPGLFSLGLIVFVWGLFEYFIQGGSDEQAREKAKALMLYGILVTLLMMFIWGIGNIFAGRAGA